jgi:hypothetical protein
MVETFMRPIEKAPTCIDICIFGQDGYGLYQIPFPCRLEAGRWINTHLRDEIKIMPVGWKPWTERDRRIGRSKNQPTFPFRVGF